MGDDVEGAFNDLVGELDYAMLVVTVSAGGERGGCLVGFATQTSISPPRFAICLSDKNRTYRLARGAGYIGVHFLAADDEDLAELFGAETGDEIDKFARVAWTPGPDGAPLLDRCLNRFVGRIVDDRPVGDHHWFLLAPVLAEHAERLRPFPFHRAKRLEPGHEA
ncbi:MAG: flavin reductase [Solirubrobacterales bacterium]|nr:flavin reductase [Solirubrobacterales bacterium]